MNTIFTPRWFLKVFTPLVRTAVSKGINPRTQDRFIQWIKDHKDDSINCMWGTILAFMGEVGLDYDAFVDDALVEID